TVSSCQYRISSDIVVFLLGVRRMSDPAVPWVDGLTIGRTLRETARRHPDRPALVFPQFDYRRTYAEFDSEVDATAKALLGLGIGKGEQVALWATNWPQWVLLQFGAARI